jgi:hypothetical protein
MLIARLMLGIGGRHSIRFLHGMRLFAEPNS